MTFTLFDFTGGYHVYYVHGYWRTPVWTFYFGSGLPVAGDVGYTDYYRCYV